MPLEVRSSGCSGPKYLKRSSEPKRHAITRGLVERQACCKVGVYLPPEAPRSERWIDASDHVTFAPRTINAELHTTDGAQYVLACLPGPGLEKRGGRSGSLKAPGGGVHFCRTEVRKEVLEPTDSAYGELASSAGVDLASCIVNPETPFQYTSPSGYGGS